MSDDELDSPHFPSAKDDAQAAAHPPDTPQTRSPSYLLAYADINFLLRDELRPVRLQLELLKPELIQQEHGIESTVVIFGGTRIPDAETAVSEVQRMEQLCISTPDDPKLVSQLETARRIASKSKYYEEARRLAEIITRESINADYSDLVVITGGGPGIMEAANRGAQDAGGKSIGLNIVLPFEQRPNSYVSPELSFQFHYFAIRKMQFLMRAKAMIAFPGGFGTLDELFETLTLVQTRKIRPLPILLFGTEYWRQAINFDFLAAEGTIAREDLELFQYVDTVEEAWKAILQFYAPPEKQPE